MAALALAIGAGRAAAQPAPEAGAAAATPTPAPAAAAAPAPPPTAAESSTPDKDLQAAKDLFEEAQTLFIKEKYEEATEKFLGAYARKPFPAFLFNAAVCYEKQQKLDKAAEFFQKYLDADPKAADAGSVKTRIDAIHTILSPPKAPGTPDTPGSPGTPPGTGNTSPLIAAVLPAIETKGLVVIDSKPQGATIYLDSKKNGSFAQTPWQGSLPSKPVKLLLEAKGFKPEERTIGPRSDKLIDVYIALSEEHFLAWVEIVSNVPGADVFIDDKSIGAIGKTPYTGHLKPGKHTIMLERIGFVPAKREVDLAPGTATQHSIPLDKGSNGWITVGGRGTYGSKVAIDSKPTCDAPCRTEVSPGSHHVEVKRNGYEDYEGDVNVDRVVDTNIEVQWSPKPPHKAAWTTSILAAAFLGSGLYVGKLSNDNKDAIRNDIKAGLPIDSNDPRYQRGKIQAIVADGLLGVSLILAVSGVISFLSHGPESTGSIDQKPVGLAPTLHDGGAGLGAWGRF